MSTSMSASTSFSGNENDDPWTSPHDGDGAAGDAMSASRMVDEPGAELRIEAHRPYEEGALTEQTRAQDRPDVQDQQRQPDQQEQQQSAQMARKPTRLALRDNLQWKDEIKIIDAQKTTEGSTSSYIAYIIRSHLGDTRRRYSEFESLRSVLSKLYPVLIVPPIPPHHSLTDYASKQSKAKEDANVIARRKRMLQNFLNRLGRHPILGEERVFMRFLEPNLPWSEVLHAPPVTLLPKNILKASARAPADPEVSALYASLPGPSTTSAASGSPSGYGPALQEPDQRFLDSEIFTNKFSAHVSGSMEKVNRRLMKRWSELSADYAELGAVMNGFSLNEGSASGTSLSSMQGEQERRATETLATAIESTGQAIDSTYLHTNAMLQEWERSFTEPLAEYSQFSSIIKQLLKYRHSKHLQFETTRDTLENKKSHLEDLEKSEMEARRLDQALDRALSRVRPLDRPGDADGTTEPGQQPSSAATRHTSTTAEPQASNSLSASTMRKSGSKFGFLGALSHTLNGMVDTDPEVTRRNSIGKTRDSINQLESSIQAVTGDLRYANQMIQADLDRFQRQKVSDFREMCLSFSEFHKDWCQQNLDMWEEARKAIQQIDDSPAPLLSSASNAGEQGRYT